MQITHEEAHRLIQFKIDNSLNLAKEEILRTHLKDCVECEHYFDTLRETETALRQTLRKQWNVHPLPLQMDAIYGRVHSNPGVSILLSTRSALIGAVVVMFAFFAWQSVNNNTSPLQIPFGTLPMIPTPAAQFTATNTLQNDCKEIHYIVQPGDTVEGIAQHFSTSKELIIAANGLSTTEIRASDILVVSFCETTPTSTTYPPTLTITPVFETISTTPG
ncbi:MAG: LysM peptidoglycan-binding domain-containing protein [Anaerolineales bacterium]